jgi:ribosome-associated heat shock protein Hsp15
MPTEAGLSSNALPGKMRIDKWLWCARFFKTRSLATQAVDSGKVKLDAQRIKPAREISPGNPLNIQIGEYLWEIEVLALATHRGPAPVAQALYRETETSQARRQQQILAHQANRDPFAQMKGRPTKRDRRQIKRFERI